MKHIKTYQFEDIRDGNLYNISFLVNRNNYMINITEMAKPFKGKSVGHFLGDDNRRIIVEKICLRNSLTISDIDIPTSLSISNLANVFPESIIISKGGKGKQGTIVHRDIAMEFARYLSPDFGIWCNDKIFEYVEYVSKLNKTTDRCDNIVDYLNNKIQKQKSKAVASKNYGEEKMLEQL